MTQTDARRMTRAGVTLSVGEVLGKLATLAMFGVLARALGVSEFGIFSLGIGLGALLSSVTTLGLDQRLVQLAGSDPASLSARLSSLLALRGALAIAVVAASAVVLPVLVDDPSVRHTALVLVVAGCADTFAEAFRSAASVRHVQTGPAVVLVVQRLLALGLVLLALTLGAGTTGAALAYLAASVAGVALMAATARRRADVRPGARAVSRAHTGEFVAAVRVTGLNDLVSMALFRLDVVLLAALAGTVAVGHYTAAYRLLETVLFVSWSVARVILPALADGTSDPAARSRTVSGALVVVSAIYLPYAALLLTRGEEIVRLLFGDDFGSSAVIMWLAGAPLFFGLAQVGIAALLALRPDPAVLAASSLALVVNVALNALLVPTWGAAAAAATTTLAYLVQALVLLRALHRTIPSRGVVRAAALSAGASVLAGLAMLAPVPLVPAALAGGAVYAVAWWLGTRRWDRPTLDLLRTVLAPGAS